MIVGSCKVKIDSKTVLLSMIEDDTCDKCYFKINNIDCTRINRPKCSDMLREDNRCVRFHLIKELNNESNTSKG